MSSLSLEQDGVLLEIEIGQSELHIEDGNPLKIYVPNDTESQECCFKFDLPRRLASWMMTDPATGMQGKIEDGTVNVINSILNCPTSTTGRILEKEGIPDIPDIAEIPVTILEVDEPAEGAIMGSAAELDRSDGLSPRTPSRSPWIERLSSIVSTFTPPATPASRGGTDSSPGRPLNIGGLTPPPRFRLPGQQSQSQYQRLLEKVVALARRTSLPNNFRDISTAFQSLSVGNEPFEGVHYTYNSQDWEHRKEVGVAGELFVCTGSPNFITAIIDISHRSSRSCQVCKI